MSRTLISCLICVLLPACSQKAKEKAALPLDVYTLDLGDDEMNEAISEARSSFQQFADALSSSRPGYSLFALKVMFEDHVGGFEHIWITDIYFRDGQFHGTVGNTPSYTTEVEAGQQITVDLNKVSDWMYVYNGVLHGGYTLRVLRNRMSPEERNEFDKSLEFTIRD